MASLNESSAVKGGAWVVSEVMWEFTPVTTFDLIGIETRFGNLSDGRVVTLEIYGDHPDVHHTVPLLRSGTFISTSNTFAGVFFAPLTLQAGNDYFIGFRNVQ